MALRAPTLLSPSGFGKRVLAFWALGLARIGETQGLGTWGYHAIMKLGWVNGVFHSAMILGSIGPASEMPDHLAKVFAAVYAIVAGLASMALLSVILYPFVPRMGHAFDLRMRNRDE